jgi:hypothetical protein
MTYREGGIYAQVLGAFASVGIQKIENGKASVTLGVGVQGSAVAGASAGGTLAISIGDKVAGEETGTLPFLPSGKRGRFPFFRVGNGDASLSSGKRGRFPFF